jgi:pimeloyl-ACP methyl ester carboxylesterase
LSYPDGEGFLESCADYVAGGIRELGLKRVIVVGCSMGVAVTLLLWLRYPELVQAMVLSEGGESYPQADRIARPAQTVERHLRRVHHNVRRVGAHATNLGLLRPFPILRETARNDVLNVLQAGLAIRKFESEGWIGDVDVPAAVVITERDRIVRKWRQEVLHDLIPGALRYSVDGGHFAPGFGDGYATQLGQAVRDVADLSSLRVSRRRRPAVTAKRRPGAATTNRGRSATSVPRRSLAAA